MIILVEEPSQAQGHYKAGCGLRWPQGSVGFPAVSELGGTEVLADSEFGPLGQVPRGLLALSRRLAWLASCQGPRS